MWSLIARNIIPAYGCVGTGAAANVVARRNGNKAEMIMEKAHGERLMTTAELSEMLGIPIDTLYGWRHRGEGPVGYRVGRHLRYRRAAVETWLEDREDRREPARR